MRTADMELRLYECLGVKQFRALVFRLERFLHRKDKGTNINYHIAAHDPQAVDAFVKYLFYNGAIHVRNIFYMTVIFLLRYVVLGHFSPWVDPLLWLLCLKDVYCVILQRYNLLRIRQRSQRLKARRDARIDRRVRQAATCSRGPEAESDLAYVRRLQKQLKARECILIREEDIPTLHRLNALLSGAAEK